MTFHPISATDGRATRKADSNKGDANMKKSIWAAMFFVLGGLTAAQAQSDMTCADLLKANAQIDAATKAEMAKDASAAAMDKKINDYCTKNPTAKASEAMEKALQ